MALLFPSVYSSLDPADLNFTKAKCFLHLGGWNFYHRMTIKNVCKCEVIYWLFITKFIF